MAAYSSVLAWSIPWTGSLGGYSPRGDKESDTTKQLAHTQTIALRFAVFSKTDLYGVDFKGVNPLLNAWTLFFFNKAWLSYSFQTENSVRLNCMKLHFYLQNQWFHMVQPNVEKGMALHSSTLSWKIPWTEEPGGLQSMGSLRVGHDWATSLSLFTFMHWRRKWQPTPVFLPGESQGQGAWWAAVYGVAQGQTWLMRLHSSSSSSNLLCVHVPGQAFVCVSVCVHNVCVWEGRLARRPMWAECNSWD